MTWEELLSADAIGLILVGFYHYTGVPLFTFLFDRLPELV